MNPITVSLLIVLLTSVFAEAVNPDRYCIEQVTVIDGMGREPYVADVSISNGLIESILSMRDPKTECVKIEGAGKFLIPGLWDMHVHLAAEEEHAEALEVLVQSGVTTVRDAGGLNTVSKWKAEIESGERIGPHILRVGPILNGESYGSFQTKVSTPEEARMVVSELHAAAVDGIKVHRAMAPNVLEEVVRASHELGLKVSGHLPLGSPPDIACRVNLDAIEHLGSFLESWLSVAKEETASMEASIRFMLSGESDSLYACLAKQNVFVTPTLVIYPYIAKSKGTPEMIELGRKTVEAMQKIMGRFRQAGIPVMAGTDAPLMEAGIPFGLGLIEELEILAGAGYTTTELLQIATVNPARFMRMYDRVGTIMEGKRADLVLLDKSPLDDISNLRSVSAVFVSGRRIGMKGAGL